MANKLNPEQIAAVVAKTENYVNNIYLPAVDQLYKASISIGEDTPAGEQIKDKFINGFQSDFNNNVKPALDAFVKECLDLEGVAEAYKKAQVDTAVQQTTVGEIQTGSFDVVGLV